MNTRSVTTATAPARPARALAAAFFLSGAAALTFELVWFYRCGLVFGNSIWAATIVLASFMGGLAVGNMAAWGVAARTERLLHAYAAAETLVAITGVALTYALPPLVHLLVPLTRALPPSAWAVNALRLAIAFAALLVPATAIGATLPLIVGALSREFGRFGRTLGFLYGWNTLGAVAGVVVAETLLVAAVGISGSAWIAGALDLAAAAIAVSLANRNVASAPLALKPDARSILPLPRAPLVAAALAGAALLALEVVWFRFLSMFILTTTLTMSLLLAVVLAAIGLGGLAASWVVGRRHATPAGAASLALAAGVAVAVSYRAFGWLTSATQIADAPRILWLACVLSAPASFASGALFTTLGDLLDAAPGHSARAAAALTLSNSIGATLGAPIAAFALLPALGMERAFFVLAGAYLLVAAPIVRPGRTLAVAAVAFVLALALFPFGAMRDRYFARAAQTYAADGSDIVATREGPSETIFLMQQRWLGQPVYSRLVTNGFSMSGTAVPALRYMRQFAYWPMLLHQGPLRRALVICYGVGVTAGAVADLPSVESIDVVEISPDVVAMSDLIYAGGDHPLHDPRVRLHIEDGRYFLETSTDRFDLITGEPPPPRTPGAVNIYTREYFQLIYDRLADGGLATYWVPVARPSPGTDVDTIVRAFCDVFADCSLWNGTPSDLMLLGSRGAHGSLQMPNLIRAWQSPRLAAHMRDAGFELPQQIGATFLGDAEYLRQLTANTPALVDNFPQRLRPIPTRPSLSDPRYATDPAVAARFQRVLDPFRAREAFIRSPFVRALFPSGLIAQTLPWFDIQRITNRAIWEGGHPLAQIAELHTVLTTTPLHALPLWLLGTDDVKQRIGMREGATTGVGAYVRGLQALAMHDFSGAARWLDAADRGGLDAPVVRPLRAYALCLSGRLDEARRLAAGLAPRGADEQHFWEWMERTFGVGAKK